MATWCHRRLERWTMAGVLINSGSRNGQTVSSETTYFANRRAHDVSEFDQAGSGSLLKYPNLHATPRPARMP